MELVMAQQGDIDQLAGMIKIFYEQEPGLRPLRMDEALFKAQNLLEAAQEERAWPFFLRHEEAIVGYALIAPYFSSEYGGLVGLLDEYLILPEWQSKGLGSQFLRTLKHWCAEKCLKRVLLEVTDKNPRVVALYERNGFTLLERRLMAWIVRH